MLYLRLDRSFLLDGLISFPVPLSLKEKNELEYEYGQEKDNKDRVAVSLVSQGFRFLGRVSALALVQFLPKVV